MLRWWLVLASAACGRVGFQPAGTLEAGAEAGASEAGGTVVMVDNPNPFTTVADNGQSQMKVMVTTPGPNRVLVAVVAWGSANNALAPIQLGGGGLVWSQQLTETLPSGPHVGWDVVDVWTAPVPSAISNVVVTATAVGTVLNGGSGAIAIWSFSGNAGVTVTGTAQSDTGTAVGPVAAVVPGTLAGAFVAGGTCKDGGGPAYTARTDNVEVLAAWDNSTGVRCSIWKLATPSQGGAATIGSTAPTALWWVAAGAQISAL